MSAKKASQKPAGGAGATDDTSEGWTEEERAAMKERARELKASRRRGAGTVKEDPESALLAKIAEVPEPDRAMAERLHAIIKPARRPSRRNSGTGCPRMPCGRPPSL